MCVARARCSRPAAPLTRATPRTLRRQRSGRFLETSGLTRSLRRTTLNEWAPSWLATKPDLRHSSRERLEGILSTHVLKAFGNRRLSSIGNAEVREWVTGMVAAGSSPATARKAHSALNQMMRAAVADRRITFNRCQDVPLPSASVNEQRFLSRHEVTLLADCIDPRFRALSCS